MSKCPQILAIISCGTLPHSFGEHSETICPILLMNKLRLSGEVTFLRVVAELGSKRAHLTAHPATL